MQLYFGLIKRDGANTFHRGIVVMEDGMEFTVYEQEHSGQRTPLLRFKSDERDDAIEFAVQTTLFERKIVRSQLKDEI